MTDTAKLIIILYLFSVFTTSCSPAKQDALFTALSAERSGIDFSNDIHENDTSVSFINEFGFMGGGVGIGDFNNDGLKDVFFSGNQVSNRLYINKGENTFQDITEKAGLITNSWSTGVSIADVNNDGFDDIYVCVFGKNLSERSKNLLFINQHNLIFKEQAAEYGLADTSYSTQAAFFDYDKDGDLDMYLTNYLLTASNANNIVPRDRTGRSAANDKLYRNDGRRANTDHPVFTDVSLEANIKDDGYGLGVVVSDFNNDDWPDIYVANDFISSDVLWLNNRDGTFTNCIDRAIQHQSYSSMGADAADIDNDGLSDVVTLDMLPEDNQRKKTSFSFMNYERYQAERAMGYEPAFMRNMLQLNNGSMRTGDTSIPFFSEIGQLSGISATDWSWSVLISDFNNDGWKDIHVTNGIGRDFINADFLEFSNQIFSGSKTKAEQHTLIREKLASLKHVNLSNYLYLNNKNYTFSDKSDSSGVDEPSMSNGAAYADLDNDGDLDLVVNNINRKAFVFINNTITENTKPTSHYIGFKLKGNALNRNGIGTKVLVYTGGNVQVQEQYPVRGYFSTVGIDLHFGLGNQQQVDSVIAIWPDRKKQTLTTPGVDTLIELSWQNAKNEPGTPAPVTQKLFSGISAATGLDYKHRDNSFNDFAIQRLLPQKYSQLGPFLSTADINNDGLSDFFIGGGFNSSGQIFTQSKNGGFVSRKLTENRKMEEDEDCIFFDADKDGDTDLLITSGDIQYDDTSEYYRPRLYLNDSKGNFQLRQDAIPASVKTIAGCVAAGDYDGDGDLDIFIGGRISKKYPLSPRSFILQNNNGVFTDVTASVCPSLQKAGMVTAAVWADLNNDKLIDLVIAGEWMPVRFFSNQQGSLQEATSTMELPDMNGMWRSLLAADIDKDGDLDLVAGNLGLNCIYKVSGKEPMQLHTADIDGNGTIDPIPFYYIKDRDGSRRSYPAISRSQFADQVPAIKKQFLYYSDYAHARFDDIYTGKSKTGLITLQCEETRSCWLENTGKGKFVKHPLPMEAQFAPVNAMVCDDIDNDGFNDLILAGNEYQAEVMTGRYDASYGCFLKGSANRRFYASRPSETGLILRGDVKDLAVIKNTKNEKLLLAAVNNDSLRVFLITTPTK
jgi:hypothetical protein